MTEKHRFLNDPQSLHIRRRRWLTAALGGAAALAGAGLAWRTYQPQSTAPGAEAALKNHGGLRAKILTDGALRVDEAAG